MYKIGFAQEIITPPTGVGLAGYMNKRPNVGMYDDLYVKALIIQSGKPNSVSSPWNFAPLPLNCSVIWKNALLKNSDRKFSTI